MPTVQVDNFTGLSRRDNLETAQPTALYVGNNIDAMLGGSIKRRDGLRKVADLDPQSVGLYVANGDLHAAAPGGRGIPSGVFSGRTIIYDRLGSNLATFATGTLALTNGSNIATLSGGTLPVDIKGASVYVPAAGRTAIVAARVSGTSLALESNWEGPTFAAAPYELFGAPTAYPLDALIRVSAAEVFGFSQAQGVYPYIVVERWRDPADHSRGAYFEHHWVRNAFADDTVANTKIALPFDPGSSLIKLNGRLWAPDASGTSVRFNSIVNGPVDWSTPRDAGFVSALAHALGKRGIVGLGIYNNLMAIVFPDSVQLWITSEDPQQITFQRAMAGPGTTAFRTVVNCRGDLLYFTNGGFRSLHMQTVTGEIQEMDDIGAEVFDLTQAITNGDVGVAVWSQKRGSYICFFGNQAFVFKWSPNMKVAAWTTWTLDVPVDYLVELGGELFVRSGDELYVFDPDFDDGNAFEAQTHFAWGKERSPRKRWDFFEVVQTGKSDVTFAFDASDPTQYDGDPIRTEGSSTGEDKIAIGTMSPVLGVRFTGNKPWQLSGFSLRYKQLPW